MLLQAECLQVNLLQVQEQLLGESGWRVSMEREGEREGSEPFLSTLSLSSVVRVRTADFGIER